MAECKIPTKPSPIPSNSISASAAGPSNRPENGPTSAAGASSTPVIAQEYSLRVPKTNVRPISIMRFNAALGIDPSTWTSVKMAREDNSRLHKTNFIIPDEEMPKFGAGSEYGREAREEARKRKYGINKKKYDPTAQPWILKPSGGGDKLNRKYKGVREGGVSENASYFIFTQAPDGAFEVFPVQQWYNFTPIQRYKSLTSEEAEEQFGRRNKIMNYFSVMVRKRMKNEDDGDDEGVKLPGRKTTGKKASSTELKMSEMDDWADSEDEEMSDEGEDEDDAADKKKKKAKVAKGKKGQKKKKKESDDEGMEDSDDGDEEGRELDYISDTTETESEDEKEKKSDIQGVDQEQALRHLLESGSESDEEGQEKKKEEEDEGEDEPGPKNGEEPESKDKKKKKKKKSKSDKKDANSGENLSDEDDDKMDSKDEVDGSSDAKVEAGSSGSNSGNTKDGGQPDGDNVSSGSKRKASSDISNLSGMSNKKPKTEVSSVLLQSATAEGITEEAVRRYLLRKPMTVTELLHKFKSKKTKISSQDMVNVIAHILKKINPVKRVQNQKMYLYLQGR